MKVLILTGLLFAFICQAQDPNRILVIYNSKYTIDSNASGTQDSLEVAQYYLQKRDVPATHLLGIPASNSGAYTNYSLFRSEILNPINSKLQALGADQIDTLLLVYGTPITMKDSFGATVSLDNVLMVPTLWGLSTNDIQQVPNPFHHMNPLFTPDLSHFDHQFKILGHEMYLVSRLDGPTGVLGALELVDQALYGEKFISLLPGYYSGTAYVDSRYGSPGKYTDTFLGSSSAVMNGDFSTYALADQNIAFTERYITNSGLPLKWENTTQNILIGNPGATFSDGTSALSAPRALLFSGGYGLVPGAWEWLPGSLGCEFHSLSLGNLRSSTTHMTSAFRTGLTAAVGAVNEPFTNGHPHPNVFLYYVLNGYSFAEAATLANPYVGWMGISVGDPLYTPFSLKMPEQDIVPPVLKSGTPRIQTKIGFHGRMIYFEVDDTLTPESVRITVSYGMNTNYTHSANSTAGYRKRQIVSLPGLSANTTYFYQAVLTDPVGNSTNTGTLSFSIPPSALIQGVVTSTRTGNPLAGATATLFSGTKTVATGQTDSNGLYLLDLDIPSGTYKLTVSKSGYPSKSFSNIVLTIGESVTVNVGL